MRCLSRNARKLFCQRPFQGALGASLYLGTPGERDIRYRRLKCNGAASLQPISPDLLDLGSASVQKCLFVAQVSSPVARFDYALPATLIGVPLAIQIRTYAGDREDETLFRPFVTGSDGGGDQEDTILGTVSINPPIKGDDGSMIVVFEYLPSLSGLQPTGFLLRQTSGPGSLADVEIEAVDGINTFTVTGLDDSAAYEWNLIGVSDAVEAILGTVEFTADAVGPSGFTAFSIDPAD